MKHITIKKLTEYDIINDPKSFGRIIHVSGDEDLEVSDGYHTMDELYDHRIVLYIALCRNLCKITTGELIRVWRSKLHSDGSSFDGWFILGINTEKGKQITYHLPMTAWEETNFVEELEKAPEYDGHTSNDVIERLKNL